MFDKHQYIIEKITTRLQNNLSSAQLSECKNLLLGFHNLDMVNQPSDTFDDSLVGWLTAAKIIEELALEKNAISLENFISKYSTKDSKKTVGRSYDVVDESLLIEEPKEDVMKRILEEHGEENYCEDFFEDELTEEGLRQASLIDSLQTSFEGERLIAKENTPVITIKKNQQIVSPWGNTDIFQINSITFLDIDEDKEFKVRVVD